MHVYVLLTLFILGRRSKFANSASANTKLKMFLHCNSEYYFLVAILRATLLN